MSSKEAILKSLNENPRLQQPPLPGLQYSWTRYDDPAEQFARSVAAVGGRCLRVGNLAEAQQQLEQLETFSQSSERCSVVAGLGNSNVQLDQVEDAHDLQSLDYFVATGHFGVAENGAIWVTDELIRHRVALYLCQHLVLVLEASQLVNNMHEAYDRLTFQSNRWGSFISGPSKTADIEQSLVIGAHGPRSLHVMLLDECD